MCLKLIYHIECLSDFNFIQKLQIKWNVIELGIQIIPKKKYFKYQTELYFIAPLT